MADFSSALKELRKRNPYPEDVFVPLTMKEWNLFNNAIRTTTLSTDKVYGDWGHKVWLLCCDELERILGGD